MKWSDWGIEGVGGWGGGGLGEYQLSHGLGAWRDGAAAGRARGEVDVGAVEPRLVLL